MGNAVTGPAAFWDKVIDDFLLGQAYFLSPLDRWFQAEPVEVRPSSTDRLGTVE